MTNCITDPIGCGINLLGSGASDIANDAWNSICQSFADAATKLLTGFANTFVNIPDLDVGSAGVKSVYAISLGIAAAVAALLLIGQVIRTALTHDGSPVAQGISGVGKAALAFLLTLTIAGTSLEAADEISKFIITQSFGSVNEFSTKVAKLVAWDPGTTGSLLLIFALIAAALVVVLWFEMLLRNAALGVLIATSPIAAAGQVSETTKAWWNKLVGSCIQLVILKPVIALVFAVGFGMAGGSQDMETTLAGMLVLLLAVVAWPAIARFFSFASVQVGGGAGLGALLGFAAGRLSSPAAGAGQAGGISAEEFGQESANRTMASFAAKTAAGQGAGAAVAGGGTSGAAAGAAVAATGPIGLAIAGATMAQRAVNSLTGRMEQMAGHAGIQGANPYAMPAGQPIHRGPTWSGINPSKTTENSLTQGEGESAAPDDPPDDPPLSGSGSTPGSGGPTGPMATAPPRAGAAESDAPGPGHAPHQDPPTLEMPAAESEEVAPTPTTNQAQQGTPGTAALRPRTPDPKQQANPDIQKDGENT